MSRAVPTQAVKCRSCPHACMTGVLVHDTYQGIPEGGYTRLFERMLEGIPVRLGVDYLKDRAALDALAAQVSSGAARYVVPWMDAQRGDVFAALVDGESHAELEPASTASPQVLQLVVRP